MEISLFIALSPKKTEASSELKTGRNEEGAFVCELSSLNGLYYEGTYFVSALITSLSLYRELLLHTRTWKLVLATWPITADFNLCRFDILSTASFLSSGLLRRNSLAAWSLPGFSVYSALGAVFLDYEPARNILKSYLFVTSTNCKPIERKLQAKTVAFLAIRESDSKDLVVLTVPAHSSPKASGLSFFDC
jgi:hypothetical protein